MEELICSVKSIIIQGRVRNERLILSNLPSLSMIEMGREAFDDCNSMVFESIIDNGIMNEI